MLTRHRILVLKFVDDAVDTTDKCAVGRYVDDGIPDNAFTRNHQLPLPPSLRKDEGHRVRFTYSAARINTFATSVRNSLFM